MRRRIYIDPESYMTDNTGRPYLYDLDQEPDQPLGICRTGALYNEALWAEYLQAISRVSDLERQIMSELRNEPLDAVETRLAHRAKEVLDDYDRKGRMTEMDELSKEALAHAATVKPS